jgi:S-adenosylmethionine/arginine decarboxylase-like enzyme
MTPAHTAPLVQRVADFRGVQSPLLRDGAALAGLMLSAAGAAGLATLESPVVRTLPRDGLAAVLLLDAGHLVVHTFPDRDLVLLDLLVAAGRDPQKAVDVFARKFGVPEARQGPNARPTDRG